MLVSTNKNGICNRIKSLISAMMLEEDAKVFWKRNDKVNCKFSDIFKNDIETKKIPADAEVYKSWRFCIIKEGQLYVPADKSEYYDFMYEKTEPRYAELISAAISKLQFQDKLTKKVNSFKMPPDCVSVQVRTWHEVVGYQRQKEYLIEKYFAAIDKLNPEYIFVTADRKKPVQQLKKRYGKKVLTSPGRILFGRRNSRAGMQNIMVDFLLSSKNKTIIGDADSTFTEMAWWFGKCKAKIIHI